MLFDGVACLDSYGIEASREFKTEKNNTALLFGEVLGTSLVMDANGTGSEKSCAVIIYWYYLMICNILSS